MPIAMRCPGCETRFEFANDLEGKRIKCKTCGDVFRVERPARKPRYDDDRPRRRDDEDDRPSGRRRDDDESGDALPRVRYADDRPRKRRVHPMVIAGPLLGLAFLAVIVIVVLASRGKKKVGPADPADVAVAPTKSCPLEVPEKDADRLVLPDGGNLFGVLRGEGAGFQKRWTFDPYDLAAGRRVGRVELAGVEDPKAFTLSPDGKYLLITESKGIGWGGDHWLTLWSVADGKNLTPDKWYPFPRDPQRPFDAPALYRAEFVGSDRVVTVGTKREFYTYKLPSFESTADRVVWTGDDPLGRTHGPVPENLHRLQYQVAFTADHRRMAVWNGNGYTIVPLAAAGEHVATPSVRQMVSQVWRKVGFADSFRAGAVAFSPDGKLLAGIISHFMNQNHLLCVWEVTSTTAEVQLAQEIPPGQSIDWTSLAWWGNRWIVTGGSKTEGMVIDARTGLGRRQLMGPEFNRYGFGRDGRLWYAAGPDVAEPATMYVVDGVDPAALTEPDDYDHVPHLKPEYFLRRLWLEPGGVLRKPIRPNPDLHKRLIPRP
jgi:hypothetical protein